MNVQDEWISHPSGIRYGYCGCGREVKDGQKKCPLCNSELIWKEEVKEHGSSRIQEI